MSVTGLSEDMPTCPEQLPTASMVMAEDVRLGAFRTICNHLLNALVVVNKVQEMPAGWRKLDVGACTSSSRITTLLNSGQRLGLSTVVVSNKLPTPVQIVTASIHMFGGDEELRIIKKYGQDDVDHEGAKTTM